MPFPLHDDDITVIHGTIVSIAAIRARGDTVNRFPYRVPNVGPKPESIGEKYSPPFMFYDSVTVHVDHVHGIKKPS